VTPIELIGRDTESRLVDSLVAGVAEHGGSLLVLGEPGIGKSALLDRARRLALGSGWQTLATSGVEAEAELAFAGLHQLLVPIFDLVDSLPGPQRRALEAVFGVSDEPVPDLFRVAMAAFRLLTHAAEAAPVVVLADDAHWLDQPSVRVLAFIARRLEPEPIVLLAAVRTGYRTALDEARLTTLDLERLSPVAAARLVDLRAPNLHPIVRARVLAEAAGNPLALEELARSMPAEAGSRESLVPGPTTLTARLERAFATRLRELKPETRNVLLALALDGRASIEEVLRSANAPPSAIEPAIDAGLVEVVGRDLRFRHPLMRSAVRQAASPDELLAMYAALARAVPDPERRLWHRASSAAGADEEIASDLEQRAAAAQRRGAVTTAAAAMERGAALTADPRIKGRRLVSAAELAYDLGLADVVARLTSQAKQLELNSADAARLSWLDEMTSGNVWIEPGAARTFVTIARRIANGGGDVDTAIRTLVPVAHRSWWTRSRPTTRQYLVEAAQSLGLADRDPRLLVVIALADPEVVGPTVLRAVSLVRMHDVPDPVDAMYLGVAAEKAGDFALGARFLAAAVERLRDQVRLGLLTQALVHRAWAATYVGEWTAAAAAASEGAALARDTNQPQFGITGELITALVAAIRGSNPEVDRILAESQWTELATKGGPLLAPAHLARGAAALGDGRYEDAFRALWRVFDEKDEAFQRFMRWPSVLDLAEAAVGSGQARQIGGAIAELEAIAARTAPPILCAGLLCARPLLAPDDEADRLFESALASDLTTHPFLHARTLFSHGRSLRHRRRSSDARSPLRKSIELFDALGAAGWGARARDELRATGESVGRRTPDARDRLTAQELQIAQLAAAGLSNRAIAERLFVSHRTIGSHLYHIFPKLGITARTQLRDALRTAKPD
jgi:DNA-binding CsgD family transcriptional regulator